MSVLFRLYTLYGNRDVCEDVEWEKATVDVQRLCSHRWKDWAVYPLLSLVRQTVTARFWSVSDDAVKYSDLLDLLALFIGRKEIQFPKCNVS